MRAIHDGATDGWFLAASHERNELRPSLRAPRCPTVSGAPDCYSLAVLIVLMKDPLTVFFPVLLHTGCRSQPPRDPPLRMSVLFNPSGESPG